MTDTSLPLPEIPLKNVFSDIQGKLLRARAASRISTPLPAFFNPLFRKQGPVNSLLIDAVEQMRVLVGSLSEEIERRDSALRRVVDDVDESASSNTRDVGQLLPEIASVRDVLRGIPSVLSALDQRCADYERELAEGNLRLVTLEAQVADLKHQIAKCLSTNKAEHERSAAEQRGAG